MPLVAVFDTNILFSAVGWQGKPFECLEMGSFKGILIVTAAEFLAIGAAP